MPDALFVRTRPVKIRFSAPHSSDTVIRVVIAMACENSKAIFATDPGATRDSRNRARRAQEPVPAQVPGGELQPAEPLARWHGWLARTITGIR